MRRLLLTVPCALLAVPSPRAEACSQSPCWGRQFFPEPSTTVPANLPGFVWQPSREPSAADPNQVVLMRGGNGTPLPFTATARADGTFLITPSDALAEGGYHLSDTNQCLGGGGPISTFTLGPAAPLPMQLGTLGARDIQRGSLEVVTSKGSCNEVIDAAYVDISIRLAADAQPWAEALQYETLVDGKPYRAANDAGQLIPLGASWIGRGSDRILTRCDSAAPDGTFSGVEPGTHEIAMRATLPGTQVMLTSPSIVVDIQCNVACGDGGFGGHDDHPHDHFEGGCSTSGGTSGVLGLALLALIGTTRRRLYRR
jgi:MYXO-CTERM domain-containing protein